MSSGREILISSRRQAGPTAKTQRCEKTAAAGARADLADDHIGLSPFKEGSDTPCRESTHAKDGGLARSLPEKLTKLRAMRWAASARNACANGVRVSMIEIQS